MLPAVTHWTTQNAVRPTDVYAALRGSWVGTLEYRDYSDNKRYRIATMLRVSVAKDGSGVTMRFVYDDGPEKIEQSKQTVAVDFAAKTYTVTPEGESARSYTIDAASRVQADGTGRLVLKGEAQENDKPVVVRYTLDIGKDTLRMTRTTGPTIGKTEFRNEYRFTRVR
ncbi:MAG: hypothetical protein JST30_17140 [Armatimonadetes bacterium]|nr:hypothetical protein [Armatimonadota bacterium]